MSRSEHLREFVPRVAERVSFGTSILQSSAYAWGDGRHSIWQLRDRRQHRVPRALESSATILHHGCRPSRTGSLVRNKSCAYSSRESRSFKPNWTCWREPSAGCRVLSNQIGIRQVQRRCVHLINRGTTLRKDCGAIVFDWDSLSADSLSRFSRIALVRAGVFRIPVAPVVALLPPRFQSLKSWHTGRGIPAVLSVQADRRSIEGDDDRRTVSAVSGTGRLGISRRLPR